MESIHSILLVSSIYLLSLVLIYFRAFFQEKGKNLATKQDLELITSKVENIKLEITNNHFQRNDFNEKRKIAVIEFFEQFTSFLDNYVKEVSFVDVFISNPEKIRERTDIIIQQKSVLESKYWKVVLFEVEDKKFVTEIQEIVLEAFKYYHHTIEALWKFEQNSLFISMAKISSELAGKRREIKDTFMKERAELEKQVNVLPAKLLNIVRKKYLGLFTQNTTL